MRQVVARRGRYFRRYRTNWRLLLPALLLAAGVMLAVSPPARKAQPTAEEAVAVLASRALNYRDYTLVIEESGPGYSLRFTGQVSENRLYGRLEQFDLEIYARDGRYHVRGSEVFKEWQPADKAGLKTLDAIVRNPLDILSQIAGSAGIKAETGPDLTIGGVICLAYLVEVPVDIPVLPSLLTVSGEQAVPERFRAYLWFGSADHFLYRMALLFDFSGTDGRAQITRVYTLGTATEPLPRDLPQASGALEV